MNVGSLFSGIGGIDLGLERAGHTVVFQAESDEWRRDVLAARFPGVTVYEDVRHVADRQPDRGGDSTNAPGGKQPEPRRNGGAPCIDLLCGGFPCQDLSVAGRRAGLIDGERSSLFFEFARVADELVQPGGYVLVENVPGLLSSNGGRDFAVLLATLADIGFHDLAWRVLDSRYFGVPQRRRRVFILGRRARGRRACEVLLEPKGGGGDFATGRETRQGSPVASLSGLGSGGPDDNDGQGGQLVANGLTHRYGKGTDSDVTDTMVVADTLTSGSHPGSNMPGRRREDDVSLVYPLARRGRSGGSELEVGEEGIYNTLRAGNGGSSRLSQVMIGLSVRRLTPRECERLQGFPDDWTALGPDSRRYAALGDAVTVPVAEWIGRRLAA